MVVITCCNDKGALMPFEKGSVFYCFDIKSFSLAGFDFNDREEVGFGDDAGTDEKIQVLKDRGCSLFLCGFIPKDAERAVDEQKIIMLPGCIGPAEDAVKTFLSGGNPISGCGGECSSCGGSCNV